MNTKAISGILDVHKKTFANGPSVLCKKTIEKENVTHCMSLVYNFQNNYIE
jgi:hypothetical protein